MKMRAARTATVQKKKIAAIATANVHRKYNTLRRNVRERADKAKNDVDMRMFDKRKIKVNFERKKKLFCCLENNLSDILYAKLA